MYQLWYYCIPGHGKGLVAAVSGFRVKRPLKKAVVTEDFHCENANDILTFLNSSYSQGSKKMHYELTSDKINSIT